MRTRAVLAIGLILASTNPSFAEPPLKPNSSENASAEQKSTEPIRIATAPPLSAEQIASVFRLGSPTTDPPSEKTVVASLSEATSSSSVDDELQHWIEQLGSTEFALREQATARLRQIGRPALLALRNTAEAHTDIEVRMRASDIADGISEGETAGRIDSFLAGNDVGLEGWPVARRILGDGMRIREVYVDLVMRHEAVAKSLAASTSERASALRSAIISVQRGMFVEQRLPTEADAIALLLLVNDRDVTVNGVDEGALFSVLQKEVSSILLKDAQFSKPFRNLLAGWMTRPDVTNRQEMLWFAMSAEIEEALPLATSTIERSGDPTTLSMAAQATATFGDQKMIKLLQPLLDDERPAAEQQYAGGTIVQAQVRDAAAAAIILLSDNKLSEFGLNEGATHPKYSFIVQEIGFPVEDPAPRTKMLEMVRAKLVSVDPDAS